MYYVPTHNLPFAHQPTTAMGATEFHTVLARIEDLRREIVQLNEIVRNEYARTDFARTEYPRNIRGLRTEGYLPQTEVCRFRETDSHLFVDFTLPFINVGDCEVEVSGNRIVLQTRVPVAPLSRWIGFNSALPRGVECFELPDGRIELSWLSPVPFNAREVEATYREGYLSIALPRTEVTAIRQPVKIAKETRRAANGMNS